MFSTSNGSSPQTAPTTPDSSSNTGSDDFPSQGQDYSDGNHGHHAHTLWGYPHSGSAHNSGAATLNSSSNGIMTGGLDDMGMGMMGLGGFDQVYEGAQSTTPGGGGGSSAAMEQMPLQDLIHDSLLSNSPLQATTGISAATPNVFTSAWFNRMTSNSNSNSNSASNSNQSTHSSLSSSHLPSTPLNSPAPGVSMMMASSPPPASIDTAFFNPRHTQAQAYQQQQQQQQQQALPPDAFMVTKRDQQQQQSNKRYPNGHPRSGSNGNGNGTASQSQTTTGRQSPIVKVKTEKMASGTGIASASNAGMFSGSAGAVGSLRACLMSGGGLRQIYSSTLSYDHPMAEDEELALTVSFSSHMSPPLRSRSDSTSPMQPYTPPPSIMDHCQSSPYFHPNHHASRRRHQQYGHYLHSRPGQHQPQPLPHQWTTDPYKPRLQPEQCPRPNHSFEPYFTGLPSPGPHARIMNRPLEPLSLSQLPHSDNFNTAPPPALTTNTVPHLESGPYIQYPIQTRYLHVPGTGTSDTATTPYTWSNHPKLSLAGYMFATPMTSPSPCHASALRGVSSIPNRYANVAFDFPNIIPDLTRTSGTETVHSWNLSSVLNGPNTYSRWELRATNVPKKSRIETQVKLGLELNDVSDCINAPGASPDTRGSPDLSVPVTQYSYIRVPKTASVKTKKPGVLEPDPAKTLTLTAEIYCASNSNHIGAQVPCCVDCQKRERKRNIKKAVTTSSAKTSRSATASKNATPATSDVEAYGAQSGMQWGQSKEDSGLDGYVSPIDFTCSPMLDFSSGSAPLSFRIVCYCRHHKEKVGFCILLRLTDNFGRVVGEITTTPIMITDDHKSVPKLTPAHTADEEDGDSYGVSTKRRAKRVLAKYSEGDGRVKHDDGDDVDEAGVGAIRNNHRLNRKSTALSRSSTGISKLTATSSSNLGAPPITTTTNIYGRREQHDPGHRSSHSYATHSESPLATTAPSSPSAGFSPPPVSATTTNGEGSNPYIGDMDVVANSLASMPLISPTSATFQSSVDGGLSMADLMSPSMSALAAAARAPLPPSPNPYPLITKVIPASGPMLGGIEVTLLGSNFSRELLANAFIAFGGNFVSFAGSEVGMIMVDGGNVTTGAQVWSETVIICTLPPSAVAGPVEVKLLGVPVPMDMDQIQQPSAPIFVYTDENERDLMITALQTLGWQNSGQWQDARSVAMHILGAQPQSMNNMMGIDDMTGSDMSSILGGPYNFATASSGRGSARRSASPLSSPESKKVEDVVLRVLRSAQHPVTGAISQISTPHPVTGQTLLHLASALGLSKLVMALIGWKANVLIPDKNGFSPVHFACFYGQTECVEILVRMGCAHLEGRDVRGRTPLDVSGTDDVKELVLELEEEVETRKRKSRIGSEVESGGEGDDEGLSWSEADDEEEEYQPPAAVSGAKAPQSVSKRISRVNSMVSIASHKAISRAVTPFRADDAFTPMAPMTSTNPKPAPPLAPPSPTSSWGIGRNISMPWPTAGWQFPNVPAMPQFGQRRGQGSKEKLDDPNSQEAKEMFKWMMWMDAARKMWQAQEQQERIAGAEIDPPPMYSPTGNASIPGLSRDKGLPTAVGTPAFPTTLEEPPSPLSLDSPCAIPGPLDPYAHHRIRLTQTSTLRHADDTSTDLTTLTQAGVKRKTKTRDTMLIYFWIPVLILVLTWASYKSFLALGRFIMSTPTEAPNLTRHAAIEL